MKDPVIEDFGVWRTARRLVERLGGDTAARVARQARDRLRDSDSIGAARCADVVHAVERLRGIPARRAKRQS